MMRGELIWVWSETWRELWSKLAKHKTAPPDLFCELYRELTEALRVELDAQSLADIVDDPVQAKAAFRKTRPSDFKSERPLITFFEAAHTVALDVGDAPLADRYFMLVESFLEKYSLRYNIRPPFALSPTLPGIFTKLVAELRTMTRKNAHLNQLMNDVETAIGDLRDDNSDGRIRICIQKQMNLLEAMGRSCQGVTRNTLGGICEQLSTWPHEKVKDAMKNLYGFASDYPGIRHAGTPESALRNIDMRDLVAMSILLTGFSAYLTEGIDPQLVYCGE